MTKDFGRRSNRTSGDDDHRGAYGRMDKKAAAATEVADGGLARAHGVRVRLEPAEPRSKSPSLSMSCSEPLVKDAPLNGATAPPEKLPLSAPESPPGDVSEPPAEASDSLASPSVPL